MIDRGRLVVAVGLYLLAAWTVFRLVTYRRRWRELLLLAGSLLAVLLAAEVALRWFRPYESLPRFRWIASARHHHVNPPGRRMFSGYLGGTPIVVETNEDGFRTRHTRASFRERGVRVALLGDSFVFGQGVNEPEAVSARLEALLRARLGRPDVAVLNAGVISYSPFLQEIQLPGVLEGYRPHLVLLVLDATDIGDDAIYTEKASRRGEEWEFPLEGEAAFRSWGAVYELLRPGLGWLAAHLRYPVEWITGRAPLLPNYYLNYVSFEGRQENRFFIYRYPLERTRPYFERTLGHVRAMAAACARSGARFGLVVTPRYHHWNRRECPHDWQRDAYAVDEPYQYEYFRFFEERRGAVEFPIYDLLPAFRAAPPLPLVFAHDPHWNPRGHELVARALADRAVADRLLAR